MDNLQNFLQNSILPKNLDDLKGEIRILMERAESETAKAASVAKVAGMKLARTVTETLKASNLKTFFVTGKHLLTDDPSFQEFIKEAFSDGDKARAADVTYHWHVSTESIHNDAVWSAIGEQIIDMNTIEGRAEARNRLNYLKAELKKQLNGDSGVLLANGSANVVGRFMLKSGKVVLVDAYWRSSDARWYCLGWGPYAWDAGDRFLSSKGESR